MDVGAGPRHVVTSVASTAAGAARGSSPGYLPRHAPNGFGLLRLCMASLVIVQHSLALTDRATAATIGPFELLWRANFGDVAVGGFFALSGFLLWSSVHRHSPRRFIRLRMFRLFPGYWAALLVVAFLLAPLIALAAGTTDGYRLLGANSAVTYVLSNLGLIVIQPSIGEVLSANPYPHSLDGSFWTLMPEFLCYLALLVVTVVAAKFGLRDWRVPLAVALAALAATTVSGVALTGQLAQYAVAVLSLASAFFFGSTLAGLSWDARARPVHMLLAAAALALMLVFGLWVPLGPPVLAFFVITLGSVLRSGWPTKVGTRTDISYGVYLYHFPVIQLLVAMGVVGASAWFSYFVLCPLALLLTVPIALASWYAVEGPAQLRGRRGGAAAQAMTVPRTGTPDS